MAYSVDLRQRVVEAVLERGYSIRKAAELFRVGHATVERYLRQYRERGELTPGTSTGRPSLLTPEQVERLKQQLAEHDDLTLAQHCALFKATTGVTMHYETMHRWLKRLRMSRKKRVSVPANKTR